jgi:hypothetical protein
MKKKRKKLDGDCTIPPPVDVSALPDIMFGEVPHEERRVREYMARQCKDEKVVHLEKVGSEPLMGRKMGLWDVTTDMSKWWVITNPTNLYAQSHFPSLDYTISFHVGVTTRMFARDRSAYAGNNRVSRILPAVKKLEAAGHTLDDADEVEEYQSVGMKLRECLLALVHSFAKPEYLATGAEAPKRGDFIHWMEIIADAVAKGQKSQEARAYMKAVAKTAWQLVNWLTHASNVVEQDARLALHATENVVGAFLTAVEKYESGAPDRCPKCGSYRVSSDYAPDLHIDPPYLLSCERCDWVSPKQLPAEGVMAVLEQQRIAEYVQAKRANGQSGHKSQQ